MNLKKLAWWLFGIGVIALVGGGVVGVLTFDVEEFRDQVEIGKVIGGNVDEGGCYISAGYSWCEAKQECLRPWEEDCE
jgi:hypothetical protein|tara:strand:- start:345 stop:578 length:234 start_codon:yes stop_codon:yes gene_type:complete